MNVSNKHHTPFYQSCSRSSRSAMSSKDKCSFCPVLLAEAMEGRTSRIALTFSSLSLFLSSTGLRIRFFRASSAVFPPLTVIFLSEFTPPNSLGPFLLELPPVPPFGLGGGVSSTWSAAVLGTLGSLGVVSISSSMSSSSFLLHNTPVSDKTHENNTHIKCRAKAFTSPTVIPYSCTFPIHVYVISTYLRRTYRSSASTSLSTSSNCTWYG